MSTKHSTPAIAPCGDLALSRRARCRSGNIAEAADELYVEIQAWRRELTACTDLLEARAAVIRQRVSQLQREQRAQQRAA